MRPWRVVVTGRQGQLARSLLELGPTREFEVLAAGRPALELTDSRTIDATISALNPHLLINAAGYTDTEKAEIEPDVARAVNVAGAAAIAACARRLGVPIIQLSSSYVFDGLSAAPYREDDPVGPLGTYGKTKALAEESVMAERADFVILRTSLVFSPFGRNSLTNMLKRADQQDEIRVVTDQFVNPTAASDLADGILTVARNLLESPRNDDLYGIFHLTNLGVATPAEFATTAFALSAQRGGPSARVVPVTSAEFGSRVLRPLNSRLDSSKIAAIHGIKLPPWEPRLRTSIERILAGTR